MAGKSFHEWLRARGDSDGGVFFNLTTGVNSRNPSRWKQESENVYTWRPGQPGEQSYDFSAFFPFEDEEGFTRHEVDRKEGYLFALYEHRGGEGDFVPFGADED